MARGGPSKSNRALPDAGGAGSGRKDTGLPQFFKARRLAPLPGAKDKAAQPQLSKTARRKLQAAKRHAAQNGGAAMMDVEEEEDAEQQRVDAVMDADFADLQSSLHALNAQLLAPRPPPRFEAAAQDADELEGFARAALDPALTGRKDSSSRAYMRELRKVLELADVLLEVLDARDPLGCR
jgi:nuclear GTP-binding protein